MVISCFPSMPAKCVNIYDEVRAGCPKLGHTTLLHSNFVKFLNLLLIYSTSEQKNEVTLTSNCYIEFNAPGSGTLRACSPR